MDIVGPRVRSSGSQYILVVCDYAIRIPEANAEKGAAEVCGWHRTGMGPVTAFPAIRLPVPQASTGFSPFGLLYGLDVSGPLNLLQKTWEAPATNSSDRSVV